MTRRVHSLLALLVLLAAVSFSRPASAQDISAEVLPKVDPKKDEPGTVAVTVVSGSAPPAVEKLTLVQVDDKQGPIELKASELKTYVQGDESLGIVVLHEAQFLWIGNDKYSEAANKYEGLHKKLTEALDKLVTAGPPGSKGAIVNYGKGARVVYGPADLATMTGDKIGTQKEIGMTGDVPVVARDLVVGVDEAAAVLNKMGTSRKVLLVIGDGMNTDQEQGPAELAERGKKLLADKVQVFAIFVQAPVDLDGDSNGFNKLTRNVKRLESPDGLGSAMSSVVDSIADRYYVTFPGADIKLQKSFTWDGKPHEFQLKIDKEELDLPEPLVMAPKWVPPWMRKSGGTPWWVFVLIPVGLILLVVVAVKALGGRKQAPPPPVEAPAPPPVAAPAPAPMGSPKTVMIGVGGDDQGFPIVGWLVPLNGPNQFQTFKLQAGSTKIGKGGASHVVIGDGYMSSEHCQIVMSPAGFTLVDGGSTNGTLVNERRVDKHELIDNDIITMGKTNFRFKTIN